MNIRRWFYGIFIAIFSIVFIYYFILQFSDTGSDWGNWSWMIWFPSIIAASTLSFAWLMDERRQKTKTKPKPINGNRKNILILFFIISFLIIALSWITSN